MRFNYSKLRGRIVEKFGSQTNFSKAAGITFEALSKKMNNKISISQREIILWCKLLEIDASEIGAYFFTLMVQNTEQERG